MKMVPASILARPARIERATPGFGVHLASERRRHDSFVRLLITSSFSDRWKGAIGAELYRGRSGTQFGAEPVAVATAWVQRQEEVNNA